MKKQYIQPAIECRVVSLQAFCINSYEYRRDNSATYGEQGDASSIFNQKMEAIDDDSDFTMESKKNGGNGLWED